jgi:hypothetical protein
LWRFQIAWRNEQCASYDLIVVDAQWTIVEHPKLCTIKRLSRDYSVTELCQLFESNQYIPGIPILVDVCV